MIPGRTADRALGEGWAAFVYNMAFTTMGLILRDW
jgi:hypothetical protein